MIPIKYTFHWRNIDGNHSKEVESVADIKNIINTKCHSIAQPWYVTKGQTINFRDEGFYPQLKQWEEEDDQSR